MIICYLPTMCLKISNIIIVIIIIILFVLVWSRCVFVERHFYFTFYLTQKPFNFHFYMSGVGHNVLNKMTKPGKGKRQEKGSREEDSGDNLTKLAGMGEANLTLWVSPLKLPMRMAWPSPATTVHGYIQSYQPAHQAAANPPSIISSLS